MQYYPWFELSRRHLFAETLQKLPSFCTHDLAPTTPRCATSCVVSPFEPLGQKTLEMIYGVTRVIDRFSQRGGLGLPKSR